MEPVVSEVALENRNTFAVAKSNINDGRKLTQQYQVRAHPTYIVFKDGKAVGRFGGVQPKGTLVKNILDAIGN